MSDDRNFIEQSLAMAPLLEGREVTPEELATEFAKLDSTERALRLNQLNADLDNAEMSLSQAAKHIEFESALRKTHEVLRRAGR